jgi:hypothetical protein
MERYAAPALAGRSTTHNVRRLDHAQSTSHGQYISSYRQNGAECVGSPRTMWRAWSCRGKDVLLGTASRKHAYHTARYLVHGVVHQRIVVGVMGFSNLIFCDRKERSTFGMSEGERGRSPHETRFCPDGKCAASPRTTSCAWSGVPHCTCRAHHHAQRVVHGQELHRHLVYKRKKRTIILGGDHISSQEHH